MSLQDPISDMLTRIRNAGMARQEKVYIPYSKLKKGIAEVLKTEGYIEELFEIGEVPKKELVLQIKYYRREPVIEKIERVSKPSCRVYCGSEEIPKVRNNLGISILSTPIGIVSGHNAKENNVGGEILCYVW